MCLLEWQQTSHFQKQGGVLACYIFVVHNTNLNVNKRLLCLHSGILWNTMRFSSRYLPPVIIATMVSTAELTTLVWCRYTCGCSSWWWAQTRCRAPTRACGPAQWRGAAARLGCPSQSGNGQCAPGEQSVETMKRKGSLLESPPPPKGIQMQSWVKNYT